MEYFQSDFLLNAGILIAASNVYEAVSVVKSVCSLSDSVVPSVESADPVEVLRADCILFMKDGHVYKVSVRDPSPRKIHLCMFK